MFIFLTIMVIIAAGATYLTERVDRPRRQLERDARKAH
jgi:hypothetical protein